MKKDERGNRAPDNQKNTKKKAEGEKFFCARVMEIGNKHHASCIGKTAFLHNKHFVSLSLISTPRVKKNNPRVNQEQSLLPMLIPAQFTATHLLPLLTASPAVAMGGLQVPPASSRRF